MSVKVPEIGKLGKGKYVHNPLTLRLIDFFRADLYYPGKWNFDSGRALFAPHMWGNDAYGDCVIAGEANHLVRLERIEQRITVPLKDQDAIDRYKLLTGCKKPGDSNDTGLVVLDAMRNWRNVGWALGGISHVRSARNYSIAAYGELEPSDPKQLRMASYLLHGIHLGFWLPLAARSMTSTGVWDYSGQTGRDWQPGSWGGHLVYSKAYDQNSLEILTWGMKIKVTNAFIERYCDEAWAVVDNLDAWRTQHSIDVPKLKTILAQISTHVNQ